MGQYYKPVILNENNKPVMYASCYDLGSGAKLMEHSWIPNPFVRFIEAMLITNPSKIVWAGDYADQEKPSTLTKDEIKFHSVKDSEYNSEEIIKEEGINLYKLSEGVGKMVIDEEIPKGKDKYSYDYKKIAPLRYKYLINFYKEEFVDKSKTPKDADGWQIHPLPLLTCEGNGRGGGDFRGNGEGLVGRWSRDKIGVVSKKSDIPKGFEEVDFDLSE